MHYYIGICLLRFAISIVNNRLEKRRLYNKSNTNKLFTSSIFYFFLHNTAEPYTSYSLFEVVNAISENGSKVHKFTSAGLEMNTICEI
jgi:hypothetical protein